MATQSHSFTAPCRPIDFSPYQLQPRVALSLAISGMIGWIAERLADPWDLVASQGIGLALALGRISYPSFPQPQEWRGIEVSTTGRIRGEGTYLDAAASLRTADGTAAVDVHLNGRWIESEDGEMACAAPGTLPERLLADLPAGCVDPSNPPNPLPRRLAGLRAEGTRLAESIYRTRVFRQSCEVADQWSSIDIPLFAACAREELALEQGTRLRDLRLGLSRPVSAIDFSLMHPFYFGDRLCVATTAYRVSDGVTFVHRLTSDSGTAHGIVVEDCCRDTPEALEQEATWRT
ncbi:hypothetical protein [Streptomyces poriticola]|uniref:hypothetical protein n=1 Tax=Streptomyces poriticola TaxID=3120506 RepID=UPI002FCDFC1C